MAILRAKKDLIMTEGTIWKQLVRFSIPLLIGNLFQLLYSTVDTIVVGNFVGKEALAAVGSTGNAINTLIGFFMGLATGAGVVVSQYFGAQDDANVEKAVHTALTMTGVLSILCTIAGILYVDPILSFMGTPEDVLQEAREYLTIYFAGVIGLLFYNMGAGILRAVGDSTRPLYFLIFSSVVNTVLDLVMVIVFHLGIAGVAYATIFSQIVSAVLVLVTLAREKGSYRLDIRKLGMDKKLVGQIVKIGFPTAFQAAITSFSNVYVQSCINHFGSACMAGWSTYGKIDQFVGLPVQTLSLTITTFVGQNLGAGNVKRAKRGTNIAVLSSIGIMAVLMIPVELFAPQLTMFFNQDPEVVEYGAMFLRVITPFMLTHCPNQIYSGTLRGAGNTKAPMFIMIGCFIIFRQIYLFIITHVMDSIFWVCLGYPFGWILCSIIITTYFKFSGWEKKRMNITGVADVE